MIMELFRGGGIMMWPMLLIGIGLVVVAVRTALRVRRAAPAEAERGMISILFWGTMGLIHGLLGTVIGFIQMGMVIQRVNSVEPITVRGGVTVALITSGFGLLLFILALACWYGVRFISVRSQPVRA